MNAALMCSINLVEVDIHPSPLVRLIFVRAQRAVSRVLPCLDTLATKIGSNLFPVASWSGASVLPPCTGYNSTMVFGAIAAFAV